MKLWSKFKIHPLTIFILLVGYLSGLGKYMFWVFSIVLIHEAGHICIMNLLKRKVASVEILPFGGLTKVDAFISEAILEDMLIAVGGIFFQTILGFILIILYKYGYLDNETFRFVNVYNITILTFNLIPIAPLDGSKIVKLISEVFIPYRFTFIFSFCLSVIALIMIVLYDLDLFLNNIFVFAFLMFMIIEEVQSCKYMFNRFLLERLHYEFSYPIKNISSHRYMYKNRTHNIRGVYEKEYLKHLFTSKIH